jgi:hypothetical protein
VASRLHQHGLAQCLESACICTKSKLLLARETKRRAQEITAGKRGSAEHRSILSRMIEIGKENEKRPSDMAHLEVITGIFLASIYMF